MTCPWPAQSGNIDYISPPPSEEWMNSKRRIAILGSTGSIGCNALRVVQSYPERFEVIALAGARNVALLAEQALQFKPRYLGVYDQGSFELLRKLLPKSYRPEILIGADGYEEIAALEDTNTVLSAQVGAAGLRATIAAALAGKVICLANKESLVLAGDLIRKICKFSKASILPVDSEHNGVFQALMGREGKHVKRIILTASGGPFLGFTREQLSSVTNKQALQHPNWSMGAKISIDSATLMNKGLELIEAKHLYGIKATKLAAVIHPQSIVHALVEFMDNSFLAHLGKADMRMPIGHCLLWPEVEYVGADALDLLSLGNLTFSEPDIHSFPCLALALRAMNEHDGLCIVLNAANEAAVDLFLAGRISFMDIATLVEVTMNGHDLSSMDPFCLPFLTATGSLAGQARLCLNAIMELDAKSRSKVYSLAGVQE